MSGLGNVQKNIAPNGYVIRGSEWVPRKGDPPGNGKFRFRGGLYGVDMIEYALSEAGGPGTIRYVLNSDRRYVPEHDSDLPMSNSQYNYWIWSLYYQLPGYVEGPDSHAGKRRPNNKEMVAFMAGSYAQRDLGKNFSYLPGSRKESRRGVLVDNHFNIPKKHKGREALVRIREKALGTDDYDELKDLLAEFMGACYSRRQIPRIYKSARERARKTAISSVYDKGMLDEMNREIEYREPEPVTLFSDEVLAPFVQEAAGPEEEVPENKKHTLNSMGFYVPEKKSDLMIGKWEYRNIQECLLDTLRGGPGQKGVTEVLTRMGGYVFDKSFFFFSILPEEEAAKGMDSLCEAYGLDPSGISGRDGFIDAFVKDREEKLIGEFPSGKRDCRMVYAIYNNMIERQEKQNRKPIKDESVDMVRRSLEFPEQYQLELFPYHPAFW